MEEIRKLQSGTDVRGIALGSAAALTKSVATRIGKAFAAFVCDGRVGDYFTIGVGQDPRLTSDLLAKAFIEGALTNSKIHIKYCGLASTPAMFMSQVLDGAKFDAAVMISASHLGKDWNGIKFFDKNGALDDYIVRDILTSAQAVDDEVSPRVTSLIEEVLAPLSDGKTPPKSNPRLSTFNLISLYKKHLEQKVRSALGGEEPLSRLHVVIDAGNGSAGFFAELLEDLGANIKGSVYLSPDGNFPNHIPNPENSDAMASIQKAVLDSKADLGLIFDTDVDRMGCVFCDGTPVNRDSLIALVAAILAPDNSGATIVTDSVTSRRLTRFLEGTLGLKHLRYMRGYKNVINKEKELNASGVNCPLAMETSGHGALRDNYYLDDGAFMALNLCIAAQKAKREGKTLGSFIEKLEALVEERVIRLKVKAIDYQKYENEVLATFRDKASALGYTIDEGFEGVRLVFDDENVKGWILIRGSLHEAVMPLNIESELVGGLPALVKIARDLLKDSHELDLSEL